MKGILGILLKTYYFRFSPMTGARVVIPKWSLRMLNVCSWNISINMTSNSQTGECIRRQVMWFMHGRVRDSSSPLRASGR